MEEIYTAYLNATGVSIDTRTIEEGNIFFALQGTRTDGSEFIKEAVDNGASAVVFSGATEIEHENVQFFSVDDPLHILQQIANHHRKQMGAKIIALTGSNGKTTTKELLHKCLSRKFKTVSTCGNLNNHIGVPLTLLTIKSYHKMAVIEMGANHQKEIEFLCSLAEPDCGFITNFGKAHLEGFGGIEGVIKGKSELYAYLKNNGGKTYVADWDEKQKELTNDADRKIVGSGARIVDAYPLLHYTYAQHSVRTHLTGEYNFYNAILATGVAMDLGVSASECGQAVQNYIPTNNRSQIIDSRKGRIILDAYNANPTSMEKALINLAKQPEKFKVAILGDMLELGDYSDKEHRDIAFLAEKLPIDGIYLIGEEFNRVRCNRAEQYQSYEQFENRFNQNIPTGTAVLIKGSRGGRLERVLNLLNTQMEAANEN